MTRQFKSGSGAITKLAISISLVLSVFCTVIILKNMIKPNSRIRDIETQITENQNSLGDLAALTGTTKKQLSKKITDLQRQNAKLERVLGQIMQKKTSDVKWVRNLANGHSYCLTPYPLPWHLAQKWARENGGNLVIINDKDENAWLAKTFDSNIEYWIGLTDEVSEGKWFWVSGSPAQYFNWLNGEPDNYKKQQHYGAINCKSPRTGQNDPGKWNDVVSNDPRIGIVEKR